MLRQQETLSLGTLYGMVDAVLKTLAPREEMVIRLRFGLPPLDLNKISIKEARKFVSKKKGT